MKNTITFLAWTLLTIGGLTSVYFLAKTYFDGFWIWGSNITDFETTGQFGDFVGGVVGTVFALAGTLLIFLTFNEQARQNRREAFESAFFEMIRLHRENVNQMSYSKFTGSKTELAENRKVFRLIFKEFLECYREVKKYSNSKNTYDYLLIKQKEKLEKIIEKQNKSIDIIELALIDIAYSIVFYGIGEEGEIVLRDKFKRKYNHEYLYGLLKYIKLKPKRENKGRWDKWKKLLELPYEDFKSTNKELYDYRRHLSIGYLSENAKDLVYDREFDKYYGGHQHRLGHYFRHLFQSYKYLNYHKELNEEEKYFYGKMLRAQLSTYEQALLFINSISSQGMKWELTPEIDLLKPKETPEKSKLITRYNLIKNLPGYHLFGLRYKVYYPQVKYETEE